MARVEITLKMQDSPEGPRINAEGITFTPSSLGEEMEDMSQHEIMANMCQALMLFHLAAAQQMNAQKQPKVIAAKKAMRA